MKEKKREIKEKQKQEKARLDQQRKIANEIARKEQQR